MAFWVSSVEDLLEKTQQVVHLGHIQEDERLLCKKQFELQVPLWVVDGHVEGVDDLLVELDIEMLVQVKGNLHGVVPQAHQEQVFNSLVRKIHLFAELGELLQIVNLAVHLEHRIDVFSCLQELLRKEELGPWLDVILDYKLLVVRSIVHLIVLSRVSLQLLVHEWRRQSASGILREGLFNDFEITLTNKVQSITVSQVQTMKKAHDLIIDQPEIVLNCLVEDCMVEFKTINLILGPKLFDAMNLYFLEQAVNLVNLVGFVKLILDACFVAPMVCLLLIVVLS